VINKLVKDLERDVGYGIIDTWDEMLEGMPGAPATDETELGQRMTSLVTMVRQDTDEIYGRLNEAQEARASTEDYNTSLADRDCSLASGRPRSTCTACGDTETDEYTTDTGDTTVGTAGTR
ncbi:hypothetical protein Tco_1454210, partial [Tanacetum coccineum]